ncbi:hypothetical protein RJ55_06358 [Drechmeria coniospora]|nr:hypothetical protein RJ55_06358 [Drechmeria coniospora]
MEQQYSTSKVTVEYFDPHDVFKLLASGLNPRLPLRNLHWQSHAGPLRSIDTLHVELVPSGTATHAAAIATHRESDASRDDGFQTQNVGGPSSGAAEAVESTQSAPAGPGGSQRRHQIPGLRRTSYLKILFVRCDDSESYKTAVRSEVREWIKTNTPKKVSNQEMHDAFEWLIVHVILPNTAAATQPRTGGKSDGGAPEKGTASSRWRTGSTPLMEKFRSDFNSSAKGTPDRIAQVRIGINDVPYDLLPRVVPAVPSSGYSETEQDTESAWGDFMGKIKSLILTSFDQRVSQYEDDIKEKDAQRSLPGWNFCTFFILKEGLARGFESVGLVEDALVGYDELSIGLDSVLREQAATGEPESHGGALLAYTDDLEAVVKRALTQVSGDDGDAEAEDLQSKPTARDPSHEIVISSTSKPYRDLILANKVSAFDFRCYLFARQVSLLLRLGNAWVTKEELMVKLKDQQDSVLHGVAPPVAPQPRREEPENLAMLAEICQRTLEFIPSISQVMRQDIMAALAVAQTEGQTAEASPLLAEMVDNIVSSFAFSVAQQILAQTSSSALPIPPTTLTTVDGHEPKSSIPEPKTMMHPARSSSLHSASSRHPPGTEASPGSGRRLSASDADSRSKFLKIGLEELAARRAELHLLSRSILSGLGKKRGWSNGWDEAPRVSADQLDGMEDVSLDDGPEQGSPQEGPPIMAGISDEVLRTAADNSEDFHRLYEILTDKSLRHFTVANYEHAIKSCLADLAVLKVHMGEHRVAANYFSQIQPFYGSSGWTELELSILVMYSQCLDRLESHNDYVRVALDLLTKACAAEKERLQQNSALPMRAGIAGATGAAPLHGVAEKLFRLSKSLSWEAKAPLSSLFTGIRLNGAPEYHDGRDSCSLSISLHGLLPETITFDSAKVKITCVDGGPCRDLVFETNGQVILSPGRNSLTVDCNSVVPGMYRVSHMSLSASNLLLHHDQSVQQAAPKPSDVFKDADVTIFQRAGALDVKVTAAKHICLDKNNSLDLELSTGWNDVKSCEIRVRPATGGLRLLTNEAKPVDSDVAFAKPPEAGTFSFGPLGEGRSVTVRFPYSVELDLADVLAKVEVTYVTDGGTFYLAKTLTIPVSLALGVNVQDVFKQEALFSRFTVSTATASPMRLYDSELLESDLFESSFGMPSAHEITVFAKQPATLLYKIRRKAGSKPGKRSSKTMYLKLHYRVLQTEAEDLILASVLSGLRESRLAQYAKLVAEHVLREARKGVQAHDLERAALLGGINTEFLQPVAWEACFRGLGTDSASGTDVASDLAGFLTEWQRSHGWLSMEAACADPWSILIPVEVPALAVVHTADMRLHGPMPSPVREVDGATPTVRVNQVLAGTLHLRWTRAWDTDTTQREDQEFSYEVSAAADTWILGGRRKGHFVIPASSESLASTPETEAEIPLVLIPQREGWLPYPTVDIREVMADGRATQACEVDWRNLGETVRVVGDRKSTTVSLDASGPGGGPLVVESSAMERGNARVVG